jgi:hypothetical protein
VSREATDQVQRRGHCPANGKVIDGAILKVPPSTKHYTSPSCGYRRLPGEWGMHMIRVLLVLVLLALAAPLTAAPRDIAIPPALRDWTGWVLHGHERELCPRVGGSGKVCGWPGELQLEVDANGARFAQRWEMSQADWVPLPGDAQWRPESLEVDGRAAPVLLRNGTPMVHLQAGNHRLNGRIAWGQRPAELALPPAIALLSLQLDGRNVGNVRRTDSGAVAFGSSTHYEADSLQVDVARLLHDDLPATLTTWVQLSVAGRPREISLGKVLPAGYTLLALDGDLSARLLADGTLQVQAQPGVSEVLLAARAPGALTTLQVPALPAPWPQQEVLQFAGMAQFRIAQLEGLRALDPQQAILPQWANVIDRLYVGAGRAAWGNVDASGWSTFLLEPGDTATVNVRQRGLPESRPSQLHLQRSLWLDFDGAGYSVSDLIDGDIGSLRRLGMAAPWQLQSVSSGNAQLLVTTLGNGEHGDSADSAGVELRAQTAALQAQARVAAGSAGSGWMQPFDSARFVLNLPPGYRLLAAHGAERAWGSWWDAWSLLDLFLGSLLVLLGWHLGRWPAAGLLLAYVLLVWHEPAAPRITLLIALALAVVLRLTVPGAWRERTAWLQRAMLVGIVLLGLPFVANQMRLALHPQLERWAVQVGAADMPRRMEAKLAMAPALEEAMPMTIEMPASEPPSAQRPRSNNGNTASDALDRVFVSGSRITVADLFRYPDDAIPQAGSAMPAWSWQQHTLSWAGPLLPDDDLGIMLSPPWLTALWRMASVLLLATLLWQLLRALPALPARVAAHMAARSTPGANATLWVVALALSAGLAAPGAARAQTAIPDPALLDQLRTRLLAPDPRCGNDCLAVGVAEVQASGRDLSIRLQVQALADAVLRLPHANAGTLSVVSMDAATVPVLAVGGFAHVNVTPGIHNLLLRYRLDGGPVGLHFAQQPARVSVQAPGFGIAGLDRGRLVGNTLSLTPPVAAAASADEPQASVPAPAFVQVLRNFRFDREWLLDTQVLRLAPADAGFSIAVPLLAGEEVIGEAPPISAGVAQVAMPAGSDTVSWSARLKPATTLSLQAAERPDLTERWDVAVSPLLHATVQGVPLALDRFGAIDNGGYWHFLPLPGERLELAINRPEAIKGNDQVIEDVRLYSRPGKRASDHNLSFTIRATRTGELRLPLPPGAQLLSLAIDNGALPLLLAEGAVNLPVHSGKQTVTIDWRETHDNGLVLRTPAVQLGRSTADIQLSMALPDDRWLLLTHGPQIGPAVLLWSELALLVLLAPVLGRWSGTPLRWPQWLLLGLGFATVSWWAALIVAGWLLALGQRARLPVDRTQPLRFNLGQALLLALSVAALLSLLMAVPAGLLGSPDMGVRGNGSSANMLQWFDDRSASGELPVASAWTLPLWAYKAAVLAWALWLANALLGWLRWGWHCFSSGGIWLPRTHQATAAPAQTDATTDATTDTHD